MEFREWMRKVDAILENRIGGLNSNDLPDCPYRDWFDSEVSPAQAAGYALSEAGPLDWDDEEDKL
jgi:hypothetical protein